MFRSIQVTNCLCLCKVLAWQIPQVMLRHDAIPTEGIAGQSGSAGHQCSLCISSLCEFSALVNLSCALKQTGCVLCVGQQLGSSGWQGMPAGRRGVHTGLHIPPPASPPVSAPAPVAQAGPSGDSQFAAVTAPFRGACSDAACKNRLHQTLCLHAVVTAIKSIIQCNIQLHRI